MLESVNIIKGKEVREKLLIGTSKMVDAVSTTFGPKSANVAIAMFYNLPHITKDGVTVTNNINLEDPIENIACQIIKEAAKKTAEVAGDGTTSTVLLTSFLIKEILTKQITNKLNFKKNLEALIPYLETKIKELSLDISTAEEMFKVAMVASNSDEDISNMVVDIFSKIGKDGIVNVHDSKNYFTKIDIMEGIKLDRGYIDNSLNRGGSKESYDNPFIICTDLDLHTVEEAIYLVQLQENLKAPLLIICNDVHASALQVFAYNKLTRGVDIEIIRAPHIAEARKEALKDIAIVTGASFIAKDTGYQISDIVEGHLGKALAFNISSKETNIFGRLGDNNKIEERVTFYRDKIENDVDGLKANYEKRLAMLNSGAAVVYVGGSNEVDVQEKKDRLDDTIRAVKSALDSGVVKGGTLTYLELINYLDSLGEDKEAIKVLKSCFSKLHQEFSSNFVSIDLLEKEVNGKGIIDPSIVLISTIKNSIGASAMVFTTECVIVKLKQN
jgi:chaperonin GroEL